MKRVTLFSIFSVLFLLGCATDLNNDPHNSGFFGGVRGLTAGDYDARQKELHGTRNNNLERLQALREEGADLEIDRQMKTEEVISQRRQLFSLKAKNQALAKRIQQLRYSKRATEERTVELLRQQRQLTRDIERFERELEQGQLTLNQANVRWLNLERQYEKIEGL